MSSSLMVSCHGFFTWTRIRCLEAQILSVRLWGVTRITGAADRHTLFLLSKLLGIICETLYWAVFEARLALGV